MQLANELNNSKSKVKLIPSNRQSRIGETLEFIQDARQFKVAPNGRVRLEIVRVLSRAAILAPNTHCPEPQLHDSHQSHADGVMMMPSCCLSVKETVSNERQCARQPEKQAVRRLARIIEVWPRRGEIRRRKGGDNCTVQLAWRW